ncbi:MAG: excinuclease ABC subunit UvrB [Candidatus Roizmanbacteria bacterium]|nr:excinuclease ABC subunit UvrB [Candidatus Roizmanbacteria bacterium]
MFVLKSPFLPTGDQPEAIDELVAGIESGKKNQVLLGVTGSGKTFTVANVIQKLQLPTLIISHNKTLAGQIYQEMREFFPTNGVSYFVSYYDFYQPEAYLPASDTYIEKEAQINEQIDKLRLQSTTNILTRKDVIVVSSVSCIYNIGSPLDYGKYILDLKVSGPFNLHDVQFRLAQLQYDRSEFDFKRGTFRQRGSSIDIYPAYEDIGYRVSYESDLVTSIVQFDPLTGKQSMSQEALIIFPAKHFMADPKTIVEAEKQIRKDMEFEVEMHKKAGHIVEAQRLKQRVTHDLEMIKEIGYVNGIENYSRYFDGRKEGDPPYSLLHYFRQAYGDKFLVVIDESHMSVSQIRGMFNGDFARKKMLIDFGFRLKASYDNRPMKFEEFYKIPPHIIYTSATPNEWEIELSKQEALKGDDKNISTDHAGIVQQLVRPTGIVDPEIMVRPSKNEVEDLVIEIEKRVKKDSKGKILVTTLTKRIAEDLTSYLKDKGIKATYLHSDIETLERSDILDSLRKHEYDVLIGVNLLREGIDLPEVSLVAILDADKEGFLRSKTALIQTMGRAARNVGGEVLMYADTETNSMREAIDEIRRRREYQVAYNTKHNITPTTIYKPIRERIIEKEEDLEMLNEPIKGRYQEYIQSIKKDGLTPFDKKKTVKRLQKEMKRAAEDMNFEAAIMLREKIKEIS